MRIARFLPALAAVLPLAVLAKGDLPPPNPHIDRGACPFECCTYRDWKTTKPITLADKPDGKTKVADVAAGTTVRALTGLVISTPLRMTASRAYEGTPIRKGDVFYALHYAGEGFWTVWFQGKTYAADFTDTSDDTKPLDALHPKWWTQIRTKAGKTGWVLNTGQFENMDACG